MRASAWNKARGLLDSPHILVAGATGSGKSVCLNNLIVSSFTFKKPCYYSFIDLKRVELGQYRGIGNTIAYAVEIEDSIKSLDQALNIIEDRYKAMPGKQSDSPDLYIVVDELADCVGSKDILSRLVRIGRIGRAANVHLLCATQDPSRRTLKAELLQNFTTRIALRCMSPIESRQIIGVKGAEALPQYGKGIIRDSTGIHKVDIPIIKDAEIRKVTTFLTEANKKSNI